MSAKKTAWHPPFTGLLQERAPRWARVTPEVQLTTEPLRVDDVIELRADRAHDPNDTGSTLRGMWRFVVEVALLEFKSVVWPVQRGDLCRLFAYGMLVLSGRPRRDGDDNEHARDGRLSAHEVTLLMAVPSINGALREELDDLGLAMAPSCDGYHFVDRAMLPLVIVDLGVVAEREDDDVLRAFAGRRVRTLAAQRWMRQHQSKRSDTMGTQATPELEGYEDFVNFMLDGLTPEEKMMGLTPEERVAGLAPEHLVLALPTEMLRALSDDYIATLPDDVQREVRARRAR